jgi:hypothetical protein
MRVTPFDNRLTVVSRVFGDDWLSSDQGHPVQIAWDDVQRELDSRFGKRSIYDLTPVELRHFAPLTFIEKLATGVDDSRALLGFEQVILPRLRQREVFESALHECEVGSWFANGGLMVEFVPPSTNPNERTPDLNIHARGHSIEVECKRKEPIIASKIAPEMEAWIHEQCQAVLKRLHADIELNGLVIGSADEQTLGRAIARLEKLASDGVRGCRFEVDIPMSVTINESPTDVPASTEEELESWAKSKGCVSLRAIPRHHRNGVCSFSNFRGMGIFTLDGHTFNQVDRTLQSASGQLSADKLGIVVIDVDLSGNPKLNAGHEIYLRILGHALSRRIWGGPRNTRIGAIVLKLSSITKDVPIGSCFYATHGTMYLSVIQPGIESEHDNRPSSLIDCLLAASNRIQDDEASFEISPPPDEN